jgi:hydroxyethylthiazole kinase-like uncharacterized protein yjeF
MRTARAAARIGYRGAMSSAAPPTCPSNPPFALAPSPWRVLAHRPTSGALPLHAVQGTREIEAAAQVHLPPHTLMQRAGVAVARLALAIAPHARKVWLLAGPGNNGGDALEAALHLHRAGRSVVVGLLGEPGRLPDDARASLARLAAAGVPVDTTGPWMAPPDVDLAVDGLLGIGSRRAPQGPLADAVRALNALDCPVLAIDLPSGLNADTGAAPADGGPDGPWLCVRATHTLCLLTLKPGLFTALGRDHAGEIWMDNLGIGDTNPAVPPRAWLSYGGDRPARPARRHAQHKGSFGDVLVLAGAAGMAGAGVLCARAALVSGAGRVYLALLDPGGGLGYDPLMPELMMRDPAAAATLDWSRMTLACGCGGGTAIRHSLPRALHDAARLVLDADALNALADDPGLQTALRARAGRGLPSVITPHPLEAARLLGRSTAEVQADRLGAAEALCALLDCTVVLKGSGSVIASPGRLTAINASGNAALATAGTGDVLAGWLAGLWAQGLDTRDATLAAVAVHGRAADRWRRDHASAPLTASRLIEALRDT